MKYWNHVEKSSSLSLWLQFLCQGRETDVKSIYCTHYCSRCVPALHSDTSVELLMSGLEQQMLYQTGITNSSSGQCWLIVSHTAIIIIMIKKHYGLLQVKGSITKHSDWCLEQMLCSLSESSLWNITHILCVFYHLLFVFYCCCWFDRITHQTKCLWDTCSIRFHVCWLNALKDSTSIYYFGLLDKDAVITAHIYFICMIVTVSCFPWAC